MDAFNVVAGAVGIAGFLFSIVVWQRDQKRKAVEEQKATEYKERNAAILSMANAVAKQLTLIASVADRDDVTKKELKHLVVSAVWGVEAMQKSLRRTRAIESQWKFGMPSQYTAIADDVETQPEAVPNTPSGGSTN